MTLFRLSRIHNLGFAALLDTSATGGSREALPELLSHVDTAHLGRLGLGRASLRPTREAVGGGASPERVSRG
jgi:hypothetical protein